MNHETGAMLSAATGATVGSAGAVGAISMLGIPGLAPAGVASGLAGLGSIIGGGMFSGLMITAAAPLVIGAAGYGIYKAVSKDKAA
jgi:hypothetical protein